MTRCWIMVSSLSQSVTKSLKVVLKRSEALGKVSRRKKSSWSFGFCPNYLDPPPLPPNLDNLYHFFLTSICQKIWAGVSPSLPIPKLTQYIQFVKSGQKIWAGPSHPLILTKSKRTANFFRETFPK